MPLNPTKNQHYISQAEQRLNAIDPASPNQIFALDVIDRENCVLQVRNPTGSSIKNSLSFQDLFSLDVVSPSVRNNLEDLFQRYEQDIGTHSRALLAKLCSGTKDIKTEIVELFAAKLMNFLRNPFSVKKVLNTFGSAADYRFVDPALAAEFKSATEGNRPQRDQVCARFGITGDEYDRWLRTLLLLLTCTPGSSLNLFESSVKSLLEKNRTEVFILEESGTAPEHVFLLSDRGFNTQPVDLTNLGLGHATMFEFNVSARASVAFTLADPTPLVASGRMPASVVDAALRANARVTHVRDRRDLLARYNQRTVMQCAETVYAACAKPLLLEAS